MNNLAFLVSLKFLNSVELTVGFGTEKRKIFVNKNEQTTKQGTETYFLGLALYTLQEGKRR